MKIFILIAVLLVFVLSKIAPQCKDCKDFKALNQVTIAIIGTNDLHGTAFPTNMKRADTNQSYTYGGLVYMASMIQTIRNQYGPENTLLMDAGDEFQGGIESSSLVSSGKIMNDFFNTNKISAASIGNHQFDFGPKFLHDYLKRFPSDTVLSANLYSEIGQPITRFMPNTKRSKIVTVSGDIKVGIIGLTTTETPETTSGFTNNLFPAYKFQNYTEIVINESKALKINGAEIIVIMSHVGNACPGQSLNLSIWKNTTEQLQCPSDDMINLIDQLPQGTVDAVVQGHRHVIAHFYRKNIPIIGSINGGYYFNAMYLKFDKKTRKIVDSTIEGPIPVCQKVFSNTKRCDYIPPQNISTAGQLIDWNFHNVKVGQNKRTKFVFEEYALKMAPFFEHIVDNEVYLTRDKLNQCPLCNLMNQVLKDSVEGTDVSLLNTGGFRSTWIPGVIQYQHFYNMFPFDSVVQTFLITGAELKQMFSILQAGPNGFYTAGGLQMKVQRQPRKLLQIRFYNGSQIDDKTEYKMATIDFLANGGDDMKDVINITYTPRNVTVIGDLKTVMRKTLSERKLITQQMVLNKSQPRLQLI